VPLKEVVARLVAKDEPASQVLRTETQQQTRLDAITITSLLANS